MKKQTYISELTEKQKAFMPAWRDKWIAIGLKTGEANWKEFEKQVSIAYTKSNLIVPKIIVHVQSPIVGAFAAPLADAIIRELIDGAVRSAVDGAVGGAVGGAVDGAVRDAVGNAVGSAVDDAVDDAVSDAVR